MAESDLAAWRASMRDASWTSLMVGLQWSDADVKVNKNPQSECEAWWATEFDSSLGFPGEGPGAPANRPVGQDLRERVQPMTEARYRLRVNELEDWLGCQGLPPLKAMIDQQQWPAVDSSLTAYVQALHNQGAPISHGTWTLAGVQYWFPPVATHISGAWLAQRQWQRLAPVQMRPPMPTRVVLALAVTAWVCDWRRSCLALLLAFQALLRPSEVAMLRRHHLILPRDLAGCDHALVVCITQSKTMQRTSRLQSVLVTDPVVVEMADCLLARDVPSAPLVRGGLKELYKKFEFLQEQLCIQGGPFTLGTLRGGGAVFHIQECQSLALLQWRGRWTTERSVQHYLQVGLASAALADVPALARDRIVALSNLAPYILRPECNGLRSEVLPELRADHQDAAGQPGCHGCHVPQCVRPHDWCQVPAECHVPQECHPHDCCHVPVGCHVHYNVHPHDGCHVPAECHVHYGYDPQECYHQESEQSARLAPSYYGRHLADEKLLATRAARVIEWSALEHQDTLS
eukprot:1364867-Amphidinium_carterae.5